MTRYRGRLLEGWRGTALLRRKACLDGHCLALFCFVWILFQGECGKLGSESYVMCVFGEWEK
jgi:hypothetical protein